MSPLISKQCRNCGLGREQEEGCIICKNAQSKWSGRVVLPFQFCDLWQSDYEHCLDLEVGLTTLYRP